MTFLRGHRHLHTAHMESISLQFEIHLFIVKYYEYCYGFRPTAVIWGTSIF